jgi:hypothetical protein
MPPQHSRRAFIQAIGGVSFTGLAGSATAASGTTNESSTLSAAELVIPETAVPNEFERYSPEDTNRGSTPFIEKLHHLDPRFKSVATAGNAFWKGEEESDPQWVLSSIALVGADRLPRLHLEKAADVFYDEYIDEYDAETSVMIEFEKSYAARDNTADWHVDILEAPLLSETETDPSPILVERMHQQFLDNVFLGTVVFGPADGSPSVESLLEEFSTVQRDRYDSARSTQ